MLEEGGNNYVESFDRRRRRSATQAVWGLFPILRGCDNCDIVLWQGTDPEWLGKRCREPWHRWNQLDLLFEHSKSLKSEDPMICFHLRQLGGGGCFLPEKPLYQDPDKFLTRFHQMNMQGGRNISRTVIVKQWVGDPGDFLLSSGLWLPKLGYTQALIGQSCKKHHICPGLFEHIQVGWGPPKYLGVRCG